MRSKVAIIVFILLFSCGFGLLNQTVSVHAQTADELNTKINQRTNDIAVLEAQIANYQKQLDALGTQKDTLATSIKELDITAKKLAADIQVTQKKIDATTLTLDGLSLDIKDKNEIITIHTDAIKKLIADTRQLDDNPFIIQMLSGVSLADTWRYVDEIQIVETEFGAQVTELSKAKKDLETHKALVEQTKRELSALKKQLNDQKKIIDQNTQNKNALLKQTKNQESSYQALVKQNLAKKQAFEKELEDYQSQLKFVLDPKSLPLAGSSVLAWPLDVVKITQLFGKTVAAARLYVSGSHNGVDFGASIGTPVKAVLAGTVIGSGNTDLTCKGASYGNWILVRHNNGLTTVYGHLSLVAAKVGDSVQTGQVIAYSGATGYATGPHLHLSVFASNAVQIMQVPSKACGGKIYTMPVAALNAYLDPMLYLPPISKSMIYYQ